MQRLLVTLALVLAQGLFSAAAFAALNINTASVDEFVALHKGLGPAKAQVIIDYRGNLKCDPSFVEKACFSRPHSTILVLLRFVSYLAAGSPGPPPQLSVRI